MNNYNEINSELPNLRNSQVSNTIYINNNWTAVKTAGICSGSGIYSDPYVIEDLEIDAGNSGSCILIENSNAYFKIENCTLINSGYYHSGITLNNVRNSQLINNYCWTNHLGIRLITCNNNTILENDVSDNDGGGVNLAKNCKNNLISRNVVNNNSGGITLSDSDNNVVSGNIVTTSRGSGDFGSGGGIKLYRCDENLVSGNSLSINQGGGIVLSFDSCFNLIYNNTLNENYIELESKCCFNLVLKNTIKNNRNYGIIILGSNFNFILANLLINNSVCIKEIDCFKNIYFGNAGCYYVGINFIDILTVIVIIVGIKLYLKIKKSKSKRIKERDDYKVSDWLKHQYYKLGNSLQDIANEQGVSMITIKIWLDKLEKK